MSLDFDDIETYRLLLSVCSLYQVDPSVPLESEKFFRELLAKYNGAKDKDSVSVWLNEQISNSFIALGERPRWIQSCEWQYIDGVPAIFAGQIDISTQDSPMASQVFYDDTSFYVFIGKKQPPVVIMQQY